MLDVLIERAPAMRAVGIEYVEIPGGFSVRLSAAAPTPPGAAAPSPSEPDADDDDPVATEQREERELRAQWTAQWTRMTRSSGGRIPDFPANLNDARRAMATLFGGRA